MRTGGQILIDQLALNGIARLFTVPGESFLAVLDALHDTTEVEIVACRHEGAAAMMAEATGRLTAAGVGTASRAVPGVAIVTRGPGLTNAAAGLHIAMQGSTPLLLLVGLPPRDVLGRDAFQELSIDALGRGLAKWAETVRDPERIPEIIQRAIVTACSGRAGPVIVGLPEDVLTATADTADARAARIAEPGPHWVGLNQLAAALQSAEWPLVIAGGNGWTAQACSELKRFAERFDLPVVAGFRSQDVIDNRSPQYVGHAGLSMCPKLAAAMTHADLVLAIGTRLDDVTTGRYRLLSPPHPRQRTLIHVHPDPATIGVNVQPAVAIPASIGAFAASLDDVLPSVRRGAQQRWSTLRRDLRSAFEAWQSFAPSPGAVRLETVVRHLSDVMPASAIVTSGAGNYAAFLHRAFTWKEAGTQLAPMSGTMGYGLPAAIAAKLAAPEREVVCFAGDGCFQMTSAELATAVQHGLPIVVVIANNGLLGTIRAEQERRYPGRVVATSLVNPDFAALARSHGAFGERVTSDSEIPGAISRARAARRPAVLDIIIDAGAITPGSTLASLGEGLRPKE